MALTSVFFSPSVNMTTSVVGDASPLSPLPSRSEDRKADKRALGDKDDLFHALRLEVRMPLKNGEVLVNRSARCPLLGH